MRVAIVPSLFAGYPTYSVWTYDLSLELIESVNVSNWMYQRARQQ